MEFPCGNFNRHHASLNSLGLLGRLLYNNERPHQSLDYKTPAAVYRSATGGGAKIVDKFPRAVAEAPVPLRSTGSSATAKTKATSEAEAKEENKTGQRCSVAIEVKDHLKLDALWS